MIDPDSLKVYINLKWEAHHSWQNGWNLGENGKDSKNNKKLSFKEPVMDEVFQFKFCGH